MNITSLLLLPLTGALAGWLTAGSLNVFLFRPRRPLHLFGRRVQGILPAQQEQIASALARAAAQAMPMDSLRERLNQPETLAAVMPGIEAHIDTFLKQRLSEKMPALAMFLSDEILQTIKVTLTDEIAALLPDVAGRIAAGAGSPAEIERMVMAQISGMPAGQIEQSLRGMLAQSLGKLRLMGLVVGFVAGLLMMLIFWWV